MRDDRHEFEAQFLRQWKTLRPAHPSARPKALQPWARCLVSLLARGASAVAPDGCMLTLHVGKILTICAPAGLAAACRAAARTAQGSQPSCVACQLPWTVARCPPPLLQRGDMQAAQDVSGAQAPVGGAGPLPTSTPAMQEASAAVRGVSWKKGNLGGGRAEQQCPAPPATGRRRSASFMPASTSHLE